MAAIASYKAGDAAGPKFVPGEIIVKFKPRLVILPKNQTKVAVYQLMAIPEGTAYLNQTYGAVDIEKIFKNIKEEGRGFIPRSSGPAGIPDLSTYYKITFPKNVNVNELVQAYKSDPSIENASPNYLRKTCGSPDDPKYEDRTQWGLYKINLNPIGSPESGWNETTGTTEVAIAVVDTGVDWNHPDLEENIWINSPEDYNANGRFDNSPTSEGGDLNGIDDDSNGYIDDVAGWNFVSVSSAEVYPGERTGPDNNPMDFDGHGTHVSGIASAVTNNSVGVAGTAWNCKIMAVRSGFKGADGWGYLTDDDAAAGIVYAADNGAKAINMSWGDTAYAPIVAEGIGYAYAKGCVLVAAAGNSDTNIRFFPAASEKVVAVGGTDKNDVRSIWAFSAASNFGPWVDVYAPGGSGSTPNSNWIYSTMFDNTYGYNAGTSMASPYVAGAAGLVRSKFPTWEATDICSQLENTAFNKAFTLSTGIEKVKRLDVYRALVYPQADISSPAYNSSIIPGSSVSVIGTAKDLIGGDYNGYVLEASPYPYSSWDALVISSAEVSKAALGTWTVPSDLGLHRLRLRVSDTSGHTMEAFTTVTVAYGGHLRLNEVVYGPNPFNPRAGEALRIRFTLSKPASDLDLNIFDISGNLIWKKRFYFLDAGDQELTWDGKTITGGYAANGVYLFQISIKDDIKARGKIILLK